MQSVQSFRWPGARELNYNCIDGSLMLRADVLGIAADARFQNTGLERSAALSEDITWMQQEYGLSPVELSEDGPGRAYSRCHSVFPESSSSSSILSPLTSYHTRMLQAHNWLCQQEHVLCSLLKELARDSPPKFLCHFYNVYFAHTAGGRMIGTKVASMILDSRELQFYKVRHLT